MRSFVMLFLGVSRHVISCCKESPFLNLYTIPRHQYTFTGDNLKVRSNIN